MQIAEKYREQGLAALLVSADAPGQMSAARTFLAEHGVNWPTYVAANLNDAFISGLSPHWSGAIPASFFYDREGELRQEWEGAHSFPEFEDAVLAVLGPKQQEGRSNK